MDVSGWTSNHSLWGIYHNLWVKLPWLHTTHPVTCEIWYHVVNIGKLTKKIHLPFTDDFDIVSPFMVSYWGWFMLLGLPHDDFSCLAWWQCWRLWGLPVASKVGPQRSPWGESKPTHWELRLVDKICVSIVYLLEVKVSFSHGIYILSICTTS